jgi:hypothetical protein
VPPQDRIGREQCAHFFESLAAEDLAELSVTTFGTFLREFSPLWSHPIGHPACQGIPIGALACTIVDSGFRLPFFRRVAGHGRKLATDDLTRRPRGLQFRLAASSLQASHACFRFASARAWRASCRAASSFSGIPSPVWKYISSGV